MKRGGGFIMMVSFTFRIFIASVLLNVLALTVGAAESPRLLVHQANGLYQDGQYEQAIAGYDQALVENPEAVVPKFNQANSYFRLDDLSKAEELFKEVAVKSKDMDLVAKAKYNLGNTFFHQGLKQTDSNPKAAIADVNDAIRQWQSTLDLRPKDAQAARNIEVARLMVKDLLDRLKNQQDPNQPHQQDPNQPHQQQGQKQQQQQQNGQQAQDPNHPQDPNQGQAQPKQQPQNRDPNEGQQSKQPQQMQEPNIPDQDMTAQAILDQEQRNKKEREQRRQVQRMPVIKDW